MFNPQLAYLKRPCYNYREKEAKIDLIIPITCPYAGEVRGVRTNPPTGQMSSTLARFFSQAASRGGPLYTSKGIKIGIDHNHKRLII